MRRRLGAGMLCTVLALASAGAGTADAAIAASAVTGTGAFRLPESEVFGDFGGDPVQFTGTARQGDYGLATGRFNIAHHSHGGGLVAHLAGVTRLVVQGEVASITGVVTFARPPALPDIDAVGGAVAITVKDEGRADELALAFEFFGVTFPPCATVTPFLTIDWGNVVVRSPGMRAKEYVHASAVVGLPPPRRSPPRACEQKRKDPAPGHVLQTMTQHPGTIWKGLDLSVMLGLVWQAGFSVAMLAHYRRDGGSFYMTQIAGAWPYVYQHLAWLAVLAAVAFGRWSIARAVAAIAIALTVVGLGSLYDSGDMAMSVMTAVGIAAIGVVPAAVLLGRGQRMVVAGRPWGWLAAASVLAIALASQSDAHTSRVGTGYLFSGPAARGVLYVLLCVWITVVGVLAVRHGAHAARSRSAAALCAGHLLVVAVWWLAAEATAPYDGLEWMTRAAAARVLAVGAMAAALAVWARRGVSKKDDTWSRRLIDPSR